MRAAKAVGSGIPFTITGFVSGLDVSGGAAAGPPRTRACRQTRSRTDRSSVMTPRRPRERVEQPVVQPGAIVTSMKTALLRAPRTR